MWDQRHQWCWGQRDASRALLQCPGCCEALKNRQLNAQQVPHEKQEHHPTSLCPHETDWLQIHLPVMLTERAKATLASPTALRRAL